jgi:hypothetical protein
MRTGTRAELNCLTFPTSGHRWVLEWDSSLKVSENILGHFKKKSPVEE